MSVEIDSPELQAAAQEETKKYRAEVARSLLEPLIYNKQEELKQLKQISDRFAKEQTPDTIGEMFLELQKAMLEGNYEAFTLELRRRNAQQKKNNIHTFINIFIYK